MPSRKIEDLHPVLQEVCREFLAQCKREGIGAFLTCTYRSVGEQDQLYAQGRTAPGPRVTNAKGGQSEHNAMLNGLPASRAFDIAIKNSDGSLEWDTGDHRWIRAGVIGLSLGLEWGGSWGRFKDAPHFQLRKT